MQLETIHIILAVGSILISSLLAYIALKVKLEVSNSKNEIMQMTFELSGKLDTHVQLDEAKHKEIDRHLEYTDKRVDSHDMELRKRYNH